MSDSPSQFVRWLIIMTHLVIYHVADDSSRLSYICQMNNDNNGNNNDKYYDSGYGYGLRRSSLIMGVHPGCPVCLIVAASLVAVETDVGETVMIIIVIKMILLMMMMKIIIDCIFSTDTDVSRPLMGRIQEERGTVSLPANCPSQAIVDVSENMRAKIYSLFCKIGFTDLPGLGVEDHVTLTTIEKYLDFKMGEVWTETMRELEVGPCLLLIATFFVCLFIGFPGYFMSQQQAECVLGTGPAAWKSTRWSLSTERKFTTIFYFDCHSGAVANIHLVDNSDIVAFHVAGPRSAGTILHASTLRQTLLIKLAISPSHSHWRWVSKSCHWSHNARCLAG